MLTASEIEKIEMRTIKNGRQGFTLVEIMIVVAIIGLLAALCIPNLLNSRTRAQTNACIDNLRMIDGAQQQWALENGKTGTSVPQATDLQPYLGRGTGQLPVCPADSNMSFATSYTLNNCETPPTCNILPSTHLLP
jgi:prepilin-type N-terminal cleavage/methylation domain-containing protein